MADFDDYEGEDDEDSEEEWGELEDELTPDEIADLKRSMQDANDGFTFTMTVIDGEHVFKCNKCGRSAPFHERPFPHKLNCPMKNRVKD